MANRGCDLVKIFELVANSLWHLWTMPRRGIGV